MTDAAEWFKNETDAYRWLREQGYDVSRGKFNQDKNAGLLTVDGKKISKFSVLQYGMKLNPTPAKTAPAIDQAERKSVLELRNLELDVEKKELANRKEDANWLQKEDAWAQMAAVIGTLRDSLRHQVHVATPAIIHTAAGDPGRAPEVYEAVEELIGRAFNEVVHSGRIEGIFSKEEES